MGAYLSEPVLEKISEKGEKNGLCFGASAVQGWRVGMEDAHCCLPEFDDGTLLFGVYDGHGGSEVAEYTSKNLADVIKSTQSYKDGNLQQCLIDAFLQIDKNFTTEEVLADLRDLAGLNKEGDCDEDGDEAALLAEEASMPLAELLAKMKKQIQRGEEEDDDEEDDEDDDEEEEEKENLKSKNEEKNGVKEDEKKEKEMIKNGIKDNKNEVDGEGTSKESDEKVEKDEKEKDGEPSGKKNDKDDDSDDGFEEAEESEEESEEEDEDGGEEEDDEEEDEDEDLQNGLIGAKSDEVAYDSGTTAVVALLKGNHLVVSNVGDSRCVLSRNGIAIDMSVDHKPEDEEEYKRIVDAGGKVTKDGRVNGGLNLSRALGDHSYKLKDDLPPEKQQITAMPDIKETTLTESDEFMVLACDGIWNVKNSQEVVDFVSQKLKKQKESEGLDLKQICEDLFDECMAPDTSGDGTGCDNMTCIIVAFDKKRLLMNIGKSKRKISECLETEQADKKQKIAEEN